MDLFLNLSGVIYVYLESLKASQSMCSHQDHQGGQLKLNAEQWAKA
jgi:hypothetical protein